MQNFHHDILWFNPSPKNYVFTIELLRQDLLAAVLVNLLSLENMPLTHAAPRQKVMPWPKKVTDCFRSSSSECFCVCPCGLCAVWLKKGLPFLAAKTMHFTAFMCLYEQKPVFQYLFLFGAKCKNWAFRHQKKNLGFLVANTTATSKAHQPWYVYGYFGNKIPHQIVGFFPTATVNHQGPSDGYNPQIWRKYPPWATSIVRYWWGT